MGIVLNGEDIIQLLLERDPYIARLIKIPEKHIDVGAGVHNINVLKFTGTLLISVHHTEIIEAISVPNMTNVYADIWDGANAKVFTKNTANFSGMTSGTFFSKMADVSDEYVLHIPTENRLTAIPSRNIGQPFLITAKIGVDNFIRFNFSTTTGVNFKMLMIFTYCVIDGGTIANVI